MPQCPLLIYPRWEWPWAVLWSVCRSLLREHTVHFISESRSLRPRRLYGISIPQLVIYYRRYPNDPQLFRYSVTTPLTLANLLIDYYIQIGLLWCVAGYPRFVLSYPVLPISRILDTLQLGLMSSALYFYLVTSHGNYQALLNFTW